MTRIAIMDRADMNAEQARVYDAAKQSSGIVGGPYHSDGRNVQDRSAARQPDPARRIGRQPLSTDLREDAHELPKLDLRGCIGNRAACNAIRRPGR